MEIGSKIKKSRIDAKLTQEQAAEALGISRQTISNWENEKSYPDIVSVLKMSDLFIPAMQRLSPAYREYHKSLQAANEVFLRHFQQECFCKKFIEQFPPSKAQSTKIGCAFSLTAPYSEERRRAASEAAKKSGVHRKVANLYESIG